MSLDVFAEPVREWMETWSEARRKREDREVFAIVAVIVVGLLALAVLWFVGQP